MNVGKRIIELRKTRGYTTNKLATRAGISQSYLRDIELGNKNPTVEMITLICDALDISLCAFFNTEECKKLDDEILIQKLTFLSSYQKKTLLTFIDAMINNK